MNNEDTEDERLERGHRMYIEWVRQSTSPALLVQEGYRQNYSNCQIYPGAILPLYNGSPSCVVPAGAANSALSALGLQLNHVSGLRNAYTPPSEYEEYFSIYKREKAEKLQKLLRKDDFDSDEKRRACRDAFESKVLLRPAGR